MFGVDRLCPAGEQGPFLFEHKSDKEHLRELRVFMEKRSLRENLITLQPPERRLYQGGGQSLLPNNK